MKKEINVTLGERIRTLRKKKGYTREFFAEKLSVSTRFLATVESGEAGVSISTLKNIALLLDTSSDYLIGITNDMNEDFYRQSAIKKINSIDNKYIFQINKILEGVGEISKID